jgi:hypothetical protein
MPRYHFDIHENGDVERDEEGIEVPDLDTARVRAIRAIKETVTDEVIARDLVDIELARIEIRDVGGVIAAIVTYPDALDVRYLYGVDRAPEERL